MSQFPPTPEQVAIIDGFRTGDNLVIEAGAGSGKTTTLRMIASAAPRRRGLYLAYNRAIKDDAARSFPHQVQCKTSHGLAYGPVATRYKHRLGGRRVPAQVAAGILGINDPVRLADDQAPLAPQQLARIALATVGRFCHSADDEISRRHLPFLAGVETPPARAALADAILPYARRAWADLTDTAGQLHFTHDTYLKIYQLQRPRLSLDYLLVDEAQDLNPVVKAIVEAQTGSQICLVGDRCQAIYGWRGAVDAMATAQGKRLYLTQSFRFGQAVADEANKWLTVLDAELRLRGFDKIASTVGPADQPDAILTRSNATALARVMTAVEDGHRAALVGGGADIKALALAARDLQTGRGAGHPELLAFSSWGEVREYAEHDSSGSDLRVLVDLVDRYGADAIVRTVDGLVDERYAQVVVSTAHKAKGREWGTVRIATDFREPKDDPDTGERGQIDREEAMLAYVAVTRAQHQLDRAGLEWVDRWLPVGWQYRADPAERIAEVAAVAPAYVQPVDPAAEPVPERATPAPGTALEFPAAAHAAAELETGTDPAVRVWEDLRADREAMLAGKPLCPGCETHGELRPDGLCTTCSSAADQTGCHSDYARDVVSSGHDADTQELVRASIVDPECLVCARCLEGHRAGVEVGPDGLCSGCSPAAPPSVTSRVDPFELVQTRESRSLAEFEQLLEASSLGTPTARQLREEAKTAMQPELTGMPAEQRDWEGEGWTGPAYASDGEAVWIPGTSPAPAGDPGAEPAIDHPAEPDVLVVPHCYRCGSHDNCICDPDIAAVYSARNDVPAGPRPAREAWARARMAGAR